MIAVLLALTVSAGGCGSEALPEAAAKPTAERVIALAPSISETIFALGAGDRLVGVGDYSRWPPEAADLPRLGGLFDARLETIAALDPDLAILLPSESLLAGQLAGLGVEVLTVPYETLDDIGRAIRTVALRLEVEDAGEALALEIEEALAPRPGVATDQRVLLVVGRAPHRLADLLAAGPGTFLGELVARLGATNVAPDGPALYPQLGLEGVLGGAPTVILELQAEPIVARSLLVDWEEFPTLPAVARDCVRVVSGSHVLIPGPRLPRLYDELAEAIAACAARS